MLQTFTCGSPGSRPRQPAVVVRALGALVVVFGVAILGCAGTARTLVPAQSTLADTTHATIDSAGDENSPADANPIADTTTRAAADTVVTSPQTAALALIEEAAIACADSQFAAADSALQAAIVVIEATQDAADPLTNGYTSFYTQIADIYADLMPTEYLDKIPDRISVMVMEKVLARSMDSTRVSSQDSASMAKLLCQKGIVYDVPMVWNDRVYRSLVFFSRNRKGPVAKWLARSGQYVPQFRRMFADSGLPMDLAYLPIIESGFSTQAYSRAHATGIWQFIPATGKRYKLRVSYWLDERRDPVKSTRAAIGYLSDLYAEFGDWYLALAAYNCGEGGMRRAIARADTNAFWQIKLPKETMQYVPEFVAALMVAKSPQCFGYAQPDTTVQWGDGKDTVLISDCIEMSMIAEALGVDPEQFQQDNPHIPHFCTPPDEAHVTLYVPAGTRERFHEFVAQIPQEKKVSWYRYKITRGDNVGTIAKRFKVTVNALKSVNNLTSNRIIAGHYLLVPIPVTAGVNARQAAQQDSTSRTSPRSRPEPTVQTLRYKAHAGETFETLSTLFGVSIEDIVAWNRMRPDTVLAEGDIVVLQVKNKSRSAGVQIPPGADGSAYYRVVKGDNLLRIARVLGISYHDLLQWNNIDAAKPVIRAGQKLKYYPPPPPMDEQPEPVNQDSSQTQAAVQPAPAQIADTPSVSVPTLSGRVDTADRAGLDDGLTQRTRRGLSLGDTMQYLVQDGDHAGKLSRLFGVSLSELLRANGLTMSSVLRAGDTLRIPRTADAAPQADSTRKKPLRVVYYEVKRGDTLSEIARQFGTTIAQIRQLNDLTQESVATGDTLRILTTGDL